MGDNATFSLVYLIPNINYKGKEEYAIQVIKINWVHATGERNRTYVPTDNLAPLFKTVKRIKWNWSECEKKCK